MLKAILIYALVLAGIASCAAMSGTAHLKDRAIHYMEQQQ